MKVTMENVGKRINDWLLSKKEIETQYYENIIKFFNLSINYTKCPDSAWFGIQKNSISLVAGGIYLSALHLPYNHRGLWLLLDDELSIPYGDQRPVKSTQGSITPLIWFHL
ncbi:MAG TPA: hypothetical protein EYP67_03495 [Methanosarcinales archaeon]|nr:hypothetical protein [Methanosarcinales archaeon]